MNVKVNNSKFELKVPASGTNHNDSVSVAASLGPVTVVGNGGYSCQYVWFQVQAQPVRVTFDGTTPSATVGKSLPALSEDIVSANVFNAMKWIQEGASPAVVWWQPFGC